MRVPLRIVPVTFLVAVCAFGAAADDPAPLVKPVTPTGSGVRVRVPVTQDEKTLAQFKAAIPKPKGKAGETIDIKVLIDTLPNTAVVGLKTWKEWGFEVPANRIGTLPELIIPGAQIAPKPTKGRDVEFRVKDVKVNIVEAPGGRDAVFGKCDLWLSLHDLTGGTDRQFEPRFYFADRFIELTAPAAAVKRLNTGDATSPDPQATAGDQVPVFGAMTANPLPVFGFASINGVTRYTTATGKAETVSVGVSSISNYVPPGIAMTLNTARGCKVELEKAPADGETVRGKVKELRLGLLTGPGFKVQKDLVLKDVTVFVSDDKSQAFVWLGPQFVETYFTDGVYGCGPDNVWRLHGRVKADLLEDIKTRTPPKKPEPKKP
jgi:hypothetical protein